MPRPKSILQKVEVDQAGQAHNCKHNRTHRLESGDKRLKLTVNRSYKHYCVACALAIIERDIAKLQELARQLQEES